MPTWIDTPGYSFIKEAVIAAQKTVIIINRKGMGEADPELQTTLMQTYLRTINEADEKPTEICFYAEGVFLVIEDSPVLPQLVVLEDKGIRLTVCSTCLNFYDLTDRVAVGNKGTMAEIVDAQMRADKVVTL